MLQVEDKRINFILAFFILLSSIIIGKLFLIQCIDHDFWKAKAQGQHKVYSEVKSKRGEIFLNDFTPLAINKEWEYIYISPKKIFEENENIEEISKTLSETLNLDKEYIFSKFEDENRSYEIIKKRLTPEEVDSINNLEFSGVYIGFEDVRYYPQEEFASQLIGFLGGEDVGQYGIEGYYDEILQGKDGSYSGEKTVKGYLIKMINRNTEQEGADLFLTLDYNIQFTAERLLKKYKEELNFESGQILVGDPYTGKILAMAEYPSFNINEYNEVEDMSIFKNSFIQKIFEPGSIFKPITMAIGLDTGKITPEAKYYDEGFVKIGGRTIRNYDDKSYGERNMTEVLENSINTGVVFAENLIGHQKFLEYLEKFNFFKPTGIDLQGEIFSSNSQFKKGYEINFATASFGQGIEMTPIQFFRAMSVVANGGKMIKPYIVEKIIQEGKETKISPNISEEQILSVNFVNQITSMMVSVIENGYTRRAKIPGYHAAGKTGTAQVSWSALGENKTGYSEKTIQSFVGFLPAYDPEFLILIKLDNPKTREASHSATPIFKELSEYIIDLWHIPPDYETE